jgi:hypothetical protein
MGLLSGIGAAGVRPSLALAALAVLTALVACQIVAHPNDDFSSAGVVELASFSAFDEPPSSLSATPAGLFFLQGGTVYFLAPSGAAAPRALHTFAGATAPLAFDGDDTVLACDETGDAVTIRASTLAQTSPPSAPPGCIDVAASAALLAFVSTRDGGTSDGGVLFFLRVVDRTSSVAVDHADQTVTTSDVGVVAAGARVFGTFSGQVVGIDSDPHASACTFSRVGETLRPKLLVVPFTDGGETLLARGEDDGLRLVDPSGACCAFGAFCGIAPVAGAAQAGQGDFALYEGYVYWSSGNAVLRQPNDLLASAIGVETVATFGDAASVVTSLAVGDAGVFAVIGTRILVAPLRAR